MARDEFDDESPHTGGEAPTVQATGADEAEAKRRLWEQWRSSPFTIYPGAMTVAGVLGGVILGGPVGAIALAVGFFGLLGAAASGMWHRQYLYEPNLRNVSLERERAAVRAESDIARKLREQLYEVGLQDGMRELEVLTSSYRDFEKFLNSEAAERAGAGLDGFGFRRSARESYERALTALRHAAEMQQSLRQGESESVLQSELKDWEKQIRLLRKEGKKDTDRDVKILAKKIENQNRILTRREEHRQRAQALIAECNTISGQLELARLDLVAACEDRADDMRATIDGSDASSPLEQQMNIFRQVESRLREATASPLDQFNLEQEGRAAS